MPKLMMKIGVSVATIFVGVVVAAAGYFWVAEKILVTGARQNAGVTGGLETHVFTLSQYRLRPILVWRSRSEGPHAARRGERVFRAWELEHLEWVRWCDGGAGVSVSGVARYDSGEMHPLRIFYDFKHDAVLTTLDYRTRADDVDAAFRDCRAE